MTGSLLLGLCRVPVRYDQGDLRRHFLQEEQDAELRYLEENSSAFEEQTSKPEADPLQEVCSALLRGLVFLNQSVGLCTGSQHDACCIRLRAPRREALRGHAAARSTTSCLRRCGPIHLRTQLRGALKQRHRPTMKTYHRPALWSGS